MPVIGAANIAGSWKMFVCVNIYFGVKFLDPMSLDW